MGCRKKKHLRAFLDACVRDTLFTNGLKTKVFVCIIEIVKNCLKKTLKDCFSSKSRRQILKNKKLLKFFTNKKISIKKRKKRFIQCSKKEQKLFNNHILYDFINNCLECD